jgi:hypothetical protein
MANIDIDAGGAASPDIHATSQDEQLSTWKVLMLSGIGGAVFTVGSYPELLKGDVQFIIEADAAVWIGIFIRLLGGCFLGAFWGYLNSPETKPMRAFQIGLIAPAAIAGMVYANIGDQTGDTSSPSEAVGQSLPQQSDAGSSLFPFISTANAAGFADGIVAQPTSGPNDSFIKRVVKGIVGR